MQGQEQRQKQRRYSVASPCGLRSGLRQSGRPLRGWLGRRAEARLYPNGNGNGNGNGNDNGIGKWQWQWHDKSNYKGNGESKSSGNGNDNGRSPFDFARGRLSTSLRFGRGDTFICGVFRHRT
jgi:hypothetical protein